MKLRFSICLIFAAACIVACNKDNEPSNSRGYADKAELESMLQGKWLADLDGDPEQDAVLMQLDFNADGSARQTVCVTTLGGENHLYDLTYEDVAWSIEENYDGYASAGLEGDAIKLSGENEVFYMVENIGEESLNLQFAYNDSTTTISFERVWNDIDTTALVSPKPDYSHIGDLDGGDDEKGQYAAWMAKVPDERKICDMCIPGSHDSGTYGVDNVLRFAAACQGMDLRSQWDYGCRAFDLRVRLENNKLRLFHNFVPCNLDFLFALDQIKERLDQNPTETAIIIVKPEGNDMAQSWLTSKILSFLARNIAGLNLSFDEDDDTENQVMAIFKIAESEMEIIPPRADLTLGEARGKIIVVFRYDHVFQFSGGIFDTIGYANKWGGKGSITTYPDLRATSFDTYVQDVFGQNEGEQNADWLSRKQNAFNSTWDASAEDTSDCWYFNAASGYNAESFSIPNYTLTAQSIYWILANHIEENPGRGIILQDFVGLDTAKRIGLTETTAIVLDVIPLSFQPIVSAKSIANGMYCIATLSPSCKYKVSGRRLSEAVVLKNFQ